MNLQDHKNDASEGRSGLSLVCVCGQEGGEVGEWVAEDGFFNTLEQKSSHCVFIEVHKQPVYLSGRYGRLQQLTPGALALLMHLSGTKLGL